MSGERSIPVIVVAPEQSRESNQEAEAPATLIVAATSARVIFGNERAFRDALFALQHAGHKVSLICRHESWNSAVRSFFSSSCHAVLPSPLCEFPLRGYYLKCIMEFVPRYFASNYVLWRALSAGRQGRSKVVFLCGDLDTLISFNLLLVALGVPIVFRCGAAPPSHNALRRMVLKAVKTLVSRYVVDSSFMRNILFNLGIPYKKIEVVRPMPPIR